jgi:hypothetical protein
LLIPWTLDSVARILDARNGSILLLRKAESKIPFGDLDVKENIIYIEDDFSN